MLEEYLSTLGLTADEVRVYLELLEAGTVSAGLLSKRMSIPRSTLYDTLGRLSDRGLVFQTLIRGVKSYSAEPPKKVLQLFKESMSCLQESYDGYKSCLEELEKKRAGNFLRPRFKTFEGKLEVRKIFDDLLLYPEKTNKIFWPIKDAIGHVGESFLYEFNRNRIKAGVEVQSIFPKRQLLSLSNFPYLATGDEFKREIRLAPDNIDFLLGYCIYGNKVSFMSSKQEGFAFIIESAEMHDMMEAQFDYIWNQLEPFELVADDGGEFLSSIR